MKYDITYLESKDIDWFFMYGDVYVHVASAGGAIPDEVNDRETLRDLQHKVAEADPIFSKDDIIINEAIMSKMFNNNPKGREAYLESFVEMSMSGFVSLDRTNIEDINDNTYHIVCRPPSKPQMKVALNLPCIDTTKILLPEADFCEGMKLLEGFGE